MLCHELAQAVEKKRTGLALLSSRERRSEARPKAGPKCSRRGVPSAIRFVCAQPDAIADSGSHAGADSWPYAIAHREPDASADRRPDAGAHTEVRS